MSIDTEKVSNETLEIFKKNLCVVLLLVHTFSQYSLIKIYEGTKNKVPNIRFNCFL